MSKELDTIIEANINRFKEGARVLEDIARFVLQDLILFKKIKQFKQQIKVTNISQHNEVDIGGAQFKENNRREGLLEIINANSLRIQEATRVLEELTGLSKYKLLRFEAYQIHQEILNKYKIFNNSSKLTGIYPICDPHSYPLEAMAEYINQKNISICQLRMKRASKDEIYQAAIQFKALLNPKVLLIINDHFDIALLTADGVHLGQNDLPVNAVKATTPQAFIVGCTCHNLAEAKAASSYGANYISLGAVFPTKTKLDTRPISYAQIQEITTQVKIPICAIGGINYEDIAKLAAININMFAMHGSIWKDEFGCTICSQH